MISDHVTRLRADLEDRYTLHNLPDWITSKTKLNGEPFSFEGHEFQLKILSDTSREKITRKCSQVGLTELSLREALALIRVLKNTTAIYTLPTADFVEKLSKARITKIIGDSDDLKFSLSKDVDSNQLKQFGNSFIYFNGTFGQNQAISTPADILIHDEVDFSDQVVLTTYESRLKHSKYKLQRKFSTPTFPGWGIDAMFQRSRRHFNFVRCCDCQEWFLPDYYEHVKVPGWDKPLDEITKYNIHLVDWKNAALRCPFCGTIPELTPEFREWVVENPDENHDAAGFSVSPFDAPSIIDAPRLVQTSTKYERRADFVNFDLGLPFEDSKESLTKSLLDSLHVRADVGSSSDLHFLGGDLGLTCHLVVGKMDVEGKLIVVHRQRCLMGEFQKTVAQIKQRFAILVSVFDSQPYTSMILEMQGSDPYLFGGVYHSSKKLATFDITNGEEDAEKGKLPIRQAKINRNPAFDQLVDLILKRKVIFLGWTEEERDIFITQCLDMKRQQQRDKNGELEYVWVKSEAGNDHYFHALLYLFTATRLQGMVSGSLTLSIPLISTFRLKNQ